MKTLSKSPHPWTAALLAAAACALLGAGEQGRAVPAPDWYWEHNEFLTRDGGVFHADNSAYRSESEPWDAYGLSWEKGPSGQSLRGRLFGLRDGKDAATFWEFYVFWHPGEGKAYMYQVGLDGTLGTGTLEPPGADGKQRSEQTFHNVDGSTARVAHLALNRGDTHSTESFHWGDGAWKPRRTYVWKRASPERP